MTKIRLVIITTLVFILLQLGCSPHSEPSPACIEQVSENAVPIREGDYLTIFRNPGEALYQPGNIANQIVAFVQRHQRLSSSRKNKIKGLIDDIRFDGINSNLVKCQFSNWFQEDMTLEVEPFIIPYCTTDSISKQGVILIPPIYSDEKQEPCFIGSVGTKTMIYLEGPLVFRVRLFSSDSRLQIDECVITSVYDEGFGHEDVPVIGSVITSYPL